MSWKHLSLFLLGLVLTPAAHAQPEQRFYFRILFTDSATGRPVPDVTITPRSGSTHASDGSGQILFYEPGLMSRQVYFHFKTPGYYFWPGIAPLVGTTLHVEEGVTQVISLVPDKMPGANRSNVSIRTEAPRFPYPDPEGHFAIEVIDEETRRGVPLVEVQADEFLEVTDNHGRVAIHQDAILDRELEFAFSSHGYAFPTSRQRLLVQPGAKVTIPAPRINIAERLYRITGVGNEGHSIRLGLTPVLDQPNYNADVAGQDTALATVVDGRIHWFWGDTRLVSTTQRGIHAVSGATSELPKRGGLDPELGVNLTYFTNDNGIARIMAPFGPPNVLTWLLGTFRAANPEGSTSLYSLCRNVLSLAQSIETGLAKYDPTANVVSRIFVDSADRALPTHQGWPTAVRTSGRSWIYFGPTVRVSADEASLTDPLAYEVFTPLGSSSDTVLRDAEGYPDYRWVRGGELVTQQHVDRGIVDLDEYLLRPLLDDQTGAAVHHQLHRIEWNPYRKRYLWILGELFGSSSFLGELWYAEAPTPSGPWAYCRKIVTHDGMSFYNPVHHPFFDRRRGREIFFQASYSNSFSGLDPTPRYDYNQIMYRLDLTDERLILPQPVYDASPSTVPRRFSLDPDRHTPRPLAFFAHNRPSAATVPVYVDGDGDHPKGLRLDPGHRRQRPLFYAIPADAPDPPGVVVPLYEFRGRGKGSTRAYSTDPTFRARGWEARRRVLVYVWPSPYRMMF